jgi:hypothetical protein
MTAIEKTLAEIVASFDALHAAYEKGGLIATDAGNALARQLLGGGEDIYRFRREFLLVDALVRIRVARLIAGDAALRHLVVFGGNNVC